VRTYQVDAVAVAFGVREIVAQVGAVEAARGRVCVLSAEHTSLRAQEQDARRAPCAHSLRALCVERALRYCHATQDCHAPRVRAQGRGGGAHKRGSNAQARLRARKLETLRHKSCCGASPNGKCCNVLGGMGQEAGLRRAAHINAPHGFAIREDAHPVRDDLCIPKRRPAVMQ
jgi:hypothetical protein